MQNNLQIAGSALYKARTNNSKNHRER